MINIKDIEPKVLWSHFSDLNAIPRPSKKEDRIITFMMNFGQNLGLQTIKDKVGNVIIKKPASVGMENYKTVILQSHLDMVHQKNDETEFDFNNQGIEMYVDGDWVKANGTTLGADNGIGVASIMAILSSTNITHPALEALFTIDEETGMTGAKGLDPSIFDGEILLNLDTEDDDELSIGCAGGIDSNTSFSYNQEPVFENAIFIELSVKGLIGGHSGMDIDKGRGNANKLMNRILYYLYSKIQYQLISLKGGSLRNAIPRESKAIITVKENTFETLEIEFNKISQIILKEYRLVETDLFFKSKKVSNTSNSAIKKTELYNILNSIYSVYNGVYRMSPSINGLVESSSNLARVIISEGSFTTESLQRSSSESSKYDIANSIRAAFESAGCSVIQSGEYPGWEPNKESDILNIMISIYKDLFSEEPQVKACHGGLECGIFSKKLPNVDMISFGPNIRGAHSPDEKCQISSVKKFWKYLLCVLKSVPKKN